MLIVRLTSLPQEIDSFVDCSQYIFYFVSQEKGVIWSWWVGWDCKIKDDLMFTRRMTSTEQSQAGCRLTCQVVQSGNIGTFMSGEADWTLTSTISGIGRQAISSISALRVWHNSSDWEASRRLGSKSTDRWKVVSLELLLLATTGALYHHWSAVQGNLYVIINPFSLNPRSQWHDGLSASIL